MSYEITEQDRAGWSYYYALYFNLAHWTGSLTILVFMITAGIVLSGQNGKTNYPSAVAGALFFLCGTQCYLGWRIWTLGPYIQKRLEEGLCTKPNLGWIPFAYGILAFVWNYWILFGWPWSK
jgi:hypothetical protein